MMLQTFMAVIYIVTYMLKAKSVEREETAVARERLGKHTFAETDTQATIEQLLEAISAEVI
jgi:hypothetical protein